MKRNWIVSAVCVGVALTAYAQVGNARNAIEAANVQVAQATPNTPIPEGATGGRSGTPNQAQYKVKKKKVKKAQ